MMGALMMFLFGMFLSLPLALFAVIPKLANKLDTLAARFGNTRWLIGLVFVALGLWSIWFGLYVDPQAWSGQ
jgi:cytochrome c-type biogenesis protein